MKAPAPLSYAGGPRLSRVLRLLDPTNQQRFRKGYSAHLESPYFVSVQRKGHLICLALKGSDATEVYDFGLERNAQQCLSALTDCFRSSLTMVKVLVPGPPP